MQLMVVCRNADAESIFGQQCMCRISPKDHQRIQFTKMVPGLYNIYGIYAFENKYIYLLHSILNINQCTLSTLKIYLFMCTIYIYIFTTF